MTALAPPEAREAAERELREALEAVSPAMVAAAADALRSWNWRAHVSETGPVLVEALAAALVASGLLAELDALRRKVVEAEAKIARFDNTRRWNIEESGVDLLVCQGHHHRSEDCDFVRYTPAETAEAREAAATARVTEAEARASRAIRVIDEASTMGALLLMAGEMTAQERRTARAIAAGLASKVRAALSPADPSQSAEGADQPKESTP